MLKVGPLTANVDVHIRYTLEPAGRTTSVIRALDLTIQIPGLLKVAEPLVVWAFRKENVRIMAELKRYVEVKGDALRWVVLRDGAGPLTRDTGCEVDI